MQDELNEGCGHSSSESVMLRLEYVGRKKTWKKQQRTSVSSASTCETRAFYSPCRRHLESADFVHQQTNLFDQTLIHGTGISYTMLHLSPMQMAPHVTPHVTNI